jgi:hypothetical protein
MKRYIKILRAALLLPVIVGLFCLSGCSRDDSVQNVEVESEESVNLPSREITAVSLDIEFAKKAITGLGWTWRIIPPGSERNFEMDETLIPGRFNLFVEEGIVKRQIVDGVLPFKTLIDLPYDTAETILDQEGLSRRIVSVDGTTILDDDTYEPGRYDLYLVDRIVKKQSIDMVFLDQIWDEESAK